MRKVHTKIHINIFFGSNQHVCFNTVVRNAEKDNDDGWLGKHLCNIKNSGRISTISIYAKVTEVTEVLMHFCTLNLM